MLERNRERIAPGWIQRVMPRASVRCVAIKCRRRAVYSARPVLPRAGEAYRAGWRLVDIRRIHLEIAGPSRYCGFSFLVGEPG